MPQKQRRWDKGRYAKIVKFIGKPLKDGEAIQATRFVDYTCTSHGFMSQLYALARDYNVAVSCAATSTRVVYRFYDRKSPWKPNMQAFAVVKKIKAEEARNS